MLKRNIASSNLLFAFFRYRIKSPLLFSIEPSSSDSKTGDLIKSLTTGGSKKRDKKKALEKETDDEDSERDTASARPTKKSENNLPYPSGPNLLDHWVDPTQRHH